MIRNQLTGAIDEHMAEAYLRSHFLLQSDYKQYTLHIGVVSVRLNRRRYVTSYFEVI